MNAPPREMMKWMLRFHDQVSRREEAEAYVDATTCWFDYIGVKGIPPHKCSPYRAVVDRLVALKAHKLHMRPRGYRDSYLE